MAHGITARDFLMVVRHPAWHGLGVVLDHTPRSLDEALGASGLTWSVAKEPLQRSDGRPVDGVHADRRRSRGLAGTATRRSARPLGVLRHHGGRRAVDRRDVHRRPDTGPLDRDR